MMDADNAMTAADAARRLEGALSAFKDQFLRARAAGFAAGPAQSDMDKVLADLRAAARAAMGAGAAP